MKTMRNGMKSPRFYRWRKPLALGCPLLKNDIHWRRIQNNNGIKRRLRSPLVAENPVSLIWRTKFIVKTIGVQFHPPLKTDCGFDTSEISMERNTEANGPVACSKDYCWSDDATLNSTKTMIKFMKNKKKLWIKPKDVSIFCHIHLGNLKPF